MNYLNASYFFDFENDLVQNLVAEFDNESLSDKDKAIALYTKVRDDWKYDPYSISLSKETYKASDIANKRMGNCVEKSIILIACLRAVGIPSRLHLGKVKNHIAVERLTEKFGSNELTPHGMVNVFLDNKWLKISPAFNASLCELLNVQPVDFDGETDSFLQQFDSKGSKFMEYTDDYGHFEDVPVEFMIQNVKEHYPHIFDRGDGNTEFKL
ncbi:MAG: transglutaminase-like domain-containing protein [Crocinitomicaceae bacterium]|nr:transglutaminase-like domain-containing protein [Crocinitomicaceae bacterium]